MQNARITHEQRKRPNGTINHEWTVWHDSGFRVFNSERAAKEYLKEGAMVDPEFSPYSVRIPKDLRAKVDAKLKAEETKTGERISISRLTIKLLAKWACK